MLLGAAMNTHAHKAGHYARGRPEYPAAFFDFLYGEAGFRENDIIADIGCGPGNVTKFFLARGNPVIAVEPDEDMRRIADASLGGYPSYQSFRRSAEDTGLEANAVDHIFCGNAYLWFAREKAVPEFRRILRENGTVVVANLCSAGTDADLPPPFLPGAALEKTFAYAIREPLEQFLHGSLSASSAPLPGDDAYEAFCQGIRRHFKKHSQNGLLEVEMRLHCMIGKAEYLAI